MVNTEWNTNGKFVCVQCVVCGAVSIATVDVSPINEYQDSEVCRAPEYVIRKCP
jgi:hypothetical protein